jgi:Protein of unknown function (DUF4013)
MGAMNLKEIIIDAMKYSASDLKMLLLLGLVLFIADFADSLSGAGETIDVLRIFLITVVILLAILEAGYIFRIIEETIQGSKKLPQFSELKITFIHGFKEAVVLIMYFSIPLLLFILFFVKFLFTMDLDDVNGENAALFLIILAITVIIYAFFPAVLLHRAHNNGNISSSFDLKKIYHKIRNVGIKRLIIVYLGIFIVGTLVEVALADSLANSIPIIGTFIPDLIIAPYILIFSARFLGLIDS